MPFLYKTNEMNYWKSQTKIKRKNNGTYEKRKFEGDKDDASSKK